MTFLLSLFANPLVRKIGIVIGGFLILFFIARWYGNNEYYKGVDEGVKIEAERLVKAKEAEWKAREDALTNESEQIAAQGKVLDGKYAEILGMRTDLNNTLSRIQLSTRPAQVAINEKVNSIPGDLLDNAIRQLSTKLGPPQAAK
jgi:hypothetical protein